MAKCDKCKRGVSRQNDATVLQFLLTGDLAMAFATPRHLLPVVEDGETVCEGSPSRAQYLEGQPRDTRGYTYQPEYEAAIRTAYAKMQEEQPEEVVN